MLKLHKKRGAHRPWLLLLSTWALWHSVCLFMPPGDSAYNLQNDDLTQVAMRL